ncbi:hypothetical protein [Rhizosaccharibacter radicis]|uniref:Uncharacterized protein n=1 Tax=Rhizosaccharibacter radicis TaxID=2782605 RepID=A0ABT1VWB8_9PROT|nr:hypothetical protein [Acetobacteraceae bacterium KSS12]
MLDSLFRRNKPAADPARIALDRLGRSFERARATAIVAARPGLPDALRHQPLVSPRKGVDAARALNRASGLLAFSVLTDSALEHYRGAFRNKAMFTPLATSALTVAASLHGTTDQRESAHLFRDVTYALAAVTGLVGTAFHVFNVGSRVGGFRWVNFFYRAPVGAPMAILISGLFGVASERLRREGPGGRPTVFGLGAGRTLATITAGSMAGTVGEAWLLHFRGNFQNPAMYIPVTIPPASGALLMDAAIRGGEKRRTAARASLWATVATGIAGTFFHAYGVQRMMGGWRNWKQNLLDGPPVPTPPAFTGVALAGLAALDLLEGDDA